MPCFCNFVRAGDSQGGNWAVIFGAEMADAEWGYLLSKKINNTK